ncbi:MAG: hypothetical protein KF758_15545 [Anaerolineales bacterium]|nr:hypothetical protein [Anaerolineales bacterium]
MDKTKLEAILNILGEQVPPNSQLLLLGGSALTLLGSPRQSLDIDFFGDDVNPNELHRTIMNKAKELKIQVDAVPLDRFIPLPEGNETRNIYIGQFANLEIYIIDPYSIAFSKIDRGLFTDFDDLVFLIKNNYINFEELENITQKAISQAGKFDLHPDILAHLQKLKSRLK